MFIKYVSIDGKLTTVAEQKTIKIDRNSALLINGNQNMLLVSYLIPLFLLMLKLQSY